VTFAISAPFPNEFMIVVSIREGLIVGEGREDGDQIRDYRCAVSSLPLPSVIALESRRPLNLAH